MINTAGPKLVCLHCGTILQSLHKHDFKWCKCKSVAIDGGSDYTKISAYPNAKYSFDLNAELVGPRDTSKDLDRS